jgi:hypothetical protein
LSLRERAGRFQPGELLSIRFAIGQPGRAGGGEGGVTSSSLMSWNRRQRAAVGGRRAWPRPGAGGPDPAAGRRRLNDAVEADASTGSQEALQALSTESLARSQHSTSVWMMTSKLLARHGRALAADATTPVGVARPSLAVRPATRNPSRGRPVRTARASWAVRGPQSATATSPSSDAECWRRAVGGTLCVLTAVSCSVSADRYGEMAHDALISPRGGQPGREACLTAVHRCR